MARDADGNGNGNGNVDVDADDDHSTLLSLLQFSNTEEGLLRLVASGTVAAVLRRLSSSLPNLLLDRLRLIRNISCTSAGRDAFLESGGLDRVASVLVRTPPIDGEVLGVILQILGNISVAGEPQRAAVWARFFPNWFLEFSLIREPLIVDTVCTVLDTCLSSTGGGQRLAELCEPGRGLPILLEIIFTISRYSQDDNEESSLDWILFKVCVQKQYFLQVFQGLAKNNTIDAGRRFTTCFSREQACVLKILARYLSDDTKEIDAVSEDSALGLLQILNHAAAVVDFTFQIKSVLPTGNHDINVLGFSLNILKDILLLENKCSQTAVTNLLLSAGLLTLVLELLRGLESPKIVKKSMKDATEEAVPASPKRKKEVVPASPKRKKEAVQASPKRKKEAVPAPFAGKFCPYIGYRADLVAVIANCLCRRKLVQDEIREQNGIPLLLQQCVVDDDSPHLKELAIMSIISLMHGNVENQHVIAELESKEPIITHPMARTGLRVEIDKDTRCPKLVNI